MINQNIQNTLLDALIKENYELRKALKNEDIKDVREFILPLSQSITFPETFQVASVRCFDNVKREEYHVILRTENRFHQAYYLSKSMIDEGGFMVEEYLSRLHEKFIESLIQQIHKRRK